MPSYDTTRMALARHGLAPSKSRGQNFLVNRHTAERIITLAGFSPKDRILEVGVGLGALTIPLAESVARVYGLEIDSGIIRYHLEERTLPGNVELHHGDILRSDFAAMAYQLSNPLKIIANLPYSISNPFLFKIIDNRDLIDQVVVMLQKEVADRLVASPGTKEYGIPSVLFSSCATIKRLLHLDASEFHPRPKIDSQVIRINFRKNQPDRCDFSALQKIVRSSFQNRRKTLLNNLSLVPWPAMSHMHGRSEMKEKLRITLENAGIVPERRAETLSVAEFLHLTAAFEKEQML